MSSERTSIYTSRLTFLAVARFARDGSEALRARSPSGVRSSLKPTVFPLLFHLLHVLAPTATHAQTIAAKRVVRR